MGEEQPGGLSRRDPWPVMILAHNEERDIVRCLDSLYKAEPNVRLRIFVCANGCTDNTEKLVASYALTHPEVVLVSIPMPDKCNAWNVYIHEVVPRHQVESNVHFFMDGDCRANRGALSELAHQLEVHPEALAAGALPASGRSMRRDRRRMIEERAIVANLYALRGSFVREAQGKGVRIPLGLEGDDGLIGALVKWNLNPFQKYVEARIVPCPDAGFVFESMAWTRPSDWRKYWRRRIRYGRRTYEFQLLGPRLKRGGIDAMPGHVRELYGGTAACRVHWEGIQTLFNWLALREMRAQAGQETSATGR